MVFHVTSVILTEVAAPVPFPSGATWNQIHLMGAGAIALYCERLQLGGFSTNASQARQGRKEVNLLHSITAESMLLQKGKANSFCLLFAKLRAKEQGVVSYIYTVLPTPRIMSGAQ